MNEELAYVERVASAMLRLPGYIEDVARLLIRLAKLRAQGETLECEYDGVVLHIHETSTVQGIRSYFDSELIRRQWFRMRRSI